MAVTRIKNNQITDSSAGNAIVGINASTKVQDFSITAGKIANSLVYGSDLTVTGNLTVNGQTTTIDTVSTVIEDPVIVLAANQTGAPTVDIGFIGERGTSNNIAFVWDESSSEFVTAFTTDLITNTTVTISSYANFHTFDANIGGNLAITGTTSLVGNVTSALNVTGNVAAGNLNTAGQVVATGNVTGGNVSAGAGIISTTGNINGANLNATSGVTATTVIATGNVAGGNLTTAGQVVATGNVTGGNLITTGTFEAASITSTGNITGANINANLGVTATTVIATGNVAGGNLTTAGQVAATGNITGGNLTTTGITSTGSLTASTTINATGNITGGNLITTGVTSTGSLETTGNALIGGNLIVQGNISYININDLRVEDPVIILGTGPNGAPLIVNDGLDRGIYMEYFLTAGNVVGNAFMGYDNSTGNMFIANDVRFTANDIVGVNSYGTLEAGNLYIQSAVSTGNIAGGNLTTGGQVVATGNITGGNLITLGTFQSASITATGNITGGNLITTGITSTGSLTASTTVSATGNVSGGNVTTAGQVAATGNITGGNLTTAGITSTGSLTASTTINATGNITGGNILTSGAGGSITGTGNITGGNIATAGQLQGGNIVISGDNITDTNGRVNFNTAGGDVDFAVNGDTVANVFFIDAGTGTASFGSATQTTNSIAAFNATTSILVPVGNTQQRPTGVTGQFRFNTTTNAVEVYDNSQWTSVGVPVFTVIDDQQFNGDGSTVAFTINSNQTTNSCIVSINGVVQIPTIAYAVVGTTLTFTEAPQSGDLIDVRQLTTTTSVTQISNSSGNAAISVTDVTANVGVTGNLVVAGTVSVSGTGNITGANIVATSDVFTPEIVKTGSNAVGNIGQASNYFNTVFAQATSALYADLAEKYTADAEYAPGTVVVFGGDAEVTVTSTDADRAVAGVVSTNPSYIMNAGLEAEHVATVALTGRVPCQVVGSVKKGDLMVSAGNGKARAEQDPRVGTVIGKALADSEGNATIEVVVGRF
jgi:filamentous hemagglutinin